MQQVQLSDVEERVYQAVTALEARGHVPYPDGDRRGGGHDGGAARRRRCTSSPRRTSCTARTRRWRGWTSARAGAPQMA